MTANIAVLHAAGSVMRYHTNPWLNRFMQTNADHQGRCVQLLLALHPAPSVALIKAVAFHDVGEFLVGDPPSGVARYSTTMKDAHGAADHRSRIGILGHDPVAGLSDKEYEWLKFLDRLEPYLFMLLNAPQVKYVDNWPATRLIVMKAADDLGVRNVVERALTDMEIMELKG